MYFPVVVYIDFKELCCRAACRASTLWPTPVRRSGAILPIGIRTAGAEQQERDQKCRRLSLHFNGKPVTAGSFELEALILLPRRPPCVCLFALVNRTNKPRQGRFSCQLEKNSDLHSFTDRQTKRCNCRPLRLFRSTCSQLNVEKVSRILRSACSALAGQESEAFESRLVMVVIS